MKVLALSLLLLNLANSMSHAEYQIHDVVSESTSVQTVSYATPQYPSVAGYTDVDLSKANPDIDNYIRYQIPELNNAELVKSQVLKDNGINYAQIYKQNNQIYTVYVWDNPTDRMRQIKGFDKVQVINSSKITKKVRISNGNFIEVANNIFV